MMGRGDGAILMTGTYSEGDIIIDTSLSGYSENFKTFFRNFQNDTPVINASNLYSFIFIDTLADNIIWEGIRFKGSLLCQIYIKNSRNIVFKNNKFYIPDGVYGIIFDESSNCFVKGNLFRGDIGAYYPFEGVWIYKSARVVVDSNEIFGMADNGTSAFYSTGVKWSRNVIYKNYATGIQIYESKACTLYNNTIDSIESGVYILRNRGEVLTLNNSITNCKFGFNWIDGIGVVISDYNNLWNNQSNYASSGGNTVTPGPNDIEVDPQFNPDYSLPPTSPLIDKGIYVGFPYAGTAPDIGAKEYGFSLKSPIANNNKEEIASLGDMELSLKPGITSFYKKSNLIYLTYNTVKYSKWQTYFSVYDEEGLIENFEITDSNYHSYFPFMYFEGDSITFIYTTLYRHSKPEIAYKKFYYGFPVDDTLAVITEGEKPFVRRINDTFRLFFVKDTNNLKNIYYGVSNNGYDFNYFIKNLHR